MFFLGEDRFIIISKSPMVSVGECIHSGGSE